MGYRKSSPEPSHLVSSSTKTLTDLQIVGDGDCGETCAAGAKAVLESLKSGLGDDGDIVNLFRELTEIIDGTSTPHPFKKI